MRPHTQASNTGPTIPSEIAHTDSLYQLATQTDGEGTNGQHVSLARTTSIAEQMSPIREFLLVGILCAAQFTTQMGLGGTLTILHIIGRELQIDNPGVLSWLIARIFSYSRQLHCHLRKIRRYFRVQDDDGVWVCMVRSLDSGCWARGLLGRGAIYLCQSVERYWACYYVAKCIGFAGCDLCAWHKEEYGI